MNSTSVTLVSITSDEAVKTVHFIKKIIFISCSVEAENSTAAAVYNYQYIN